MASDGTVRGSSGWLMLLADVVALMLAFFVLAFSMRALTDSDRQPDGSPPERAEGTTIAPVGGVPAAAGTVAAPLARSPVDGHSIDQLQAPEQQTGGAPALAYLAAILEHGGAGWVPDRIQHDESMLTVAVPDNQDPAAGALSVGVGAPLLALAHLAARFDLDLAIVLPHAADANLEEQVAQALRLRFSLADAAVIVTPEITFDVVGAGRTGDASAARARVALTARPASTSGEGGWSP